jgi:hypothetical protein
MEYSTVLKLSDKQLNYALFGLIYGDGSYKNGWIAINHSKQLFYVKWLEEFCIVNGLQYAVSYNQKKTSNLGNYIVDVIRIKVKQKRHFEKFGRIYNSVTGKRQVSNYVLQRMSVLGLLFWYLDDGSLTIHQKRNMNAITRFIYLNTQAFSFDDNVSIQAMLKERFDIESKLHIDCSGFDSSKKYFRIYLNSTNARKLFDLFDNILQFVPVEFDYKFNMKYVPNRLKESYGYTQRYNGLLSYKSAEAV